MPGLIDIAPHAETVSVQGASVAVHGVSAKGVAHLLSRFPELRRLMTGQEVETEQLMEMGGDAVAAIIAAGCGYPGDEKAEAVAGSLSLDAQADLLAAILRLTLPKGIGPFVEKLGALTGALDVAPSAMAQLRARRRYRRPDRGNYPLADVWAMTPRQIAVTLYFVTRRRKRDLAEKLACGRQPTPSRARGKQRLARVHALPRGSARKGVLARSNRHHAKMRIAMEARL